MQIKLELYRAHTPRTLLTTFTYILCQVVRMSREHIVGSVHRRGQIKHSICNARGPY